MIFKLIFDKIFALVGLIVLGPILAAVALLIKVNMPSAPILFHQLRVGKNGKLFTLIKFRTMIVDHDGSSVSVQGEARITKLGAILRKYKIDELPEIWNVLIGDMSFVGPRPDVPGFADSLSNDDRIILSIRPGITGPASIKYRNEEELLAMQSDPIRYNNEVIWPDKVRINKEYIQNYSFGKDISYIFNTLSSHF